MILVVLPEGGCWRTLSALRKCGGVKSQRERGGEAREEGVGRTKQWGTETLGDLWKGEGWGGEHVEYKMDITGTFRKESREFEEGGLGWINGGRKDCGFGWGKIRGGGERLF